MNSLMSFTPSACMFAFVIGIVICILLVVFVFMNKNSCPKGNISTQIVSVEEEAKLNNLLCNFFIKSSYNSCATGNFMNGWVNLCALDRVIQYGCRVLDFEIYTVNGRCVVATSNSIKLTEKGSYNSLEIGEVLERIRNTAVSKSLSTEKCPNPSDPLFLHFRMKTDIESTYNELARAISSNLGNVLLSPEYNIKNYTDFCKTMKFSQLKNKVIVIVDKSNPALQSGILGEVTHIIGNDKSFHSWSYNDIAFSPDEGITDFNSLGNMTYCYPPLSYTPKNYSSVLAMQYGVQMCGLCYQNNDTFLKTYNALFDTERSAFIIKKNGYYNSYEVVAPVLTSAQQLAP